jgi:hypothetical protein
MAHKFLLSGIIIGIAFYLSPIMANAQDFSVSGATFALVHYGPGSFKAAAGAAAIAAFSPLSGLQLELGLAAGAFIGNVLGVSLFALYELPLGEYRPAAGGFVRVDFGSVLYHGRTAADFIYPFYPEWDAGLCLRPLNFRIERVAVSFLNLAAGTELAHPGVIWVLGVELLRLGYIF